MSDKIQIKTPVFRAAFVHVEEPWSSKPNYPKRYQLVAVFKDDEKLEDLRNAVLTVAKKQFGEAKLKELIASGDIRLPYAKKSTFLNKEGSLYSGFEGEGYALKMNSTNPIPISLLENGKAKTLDAKEFYSGCFAKAAVTIKAYDGGVSCFCNGLLKVADGEKLGGGANWGEDDYEVEEMDGMITVEKAEDSALDIDLDSI